MKAKIQKNSLRICMAQINVTVGAIQENKKKIIEACNKAEYELDADIIVFPELALCGYTPEDLLFRPEFVEACEKANADIVNCIGNLFCVFGTIQDEGEGLKNMAIVAHQQKVVAQYAKQHLPNHGVFDEKRYFTKGTESTLFVVKDTPIALSICEDLWHPAAIQKINETEAKAIISLNASPFEINKSIERLHIISHCVRLCKAPVFYVNLIGGQDDLIFDGGSLAMNAGEQIVAEAPLFKEDLLLVDCPLSPETSLEKKLFRGLTKHTENQFFRPQPLAISPQENTRSFSRIEKIYHALVLGVQDYIRKNNFKEVIIGNSGGIDSAVSLCIATKALGQNNVKSVMITSEHTSLLSTNLALSLAKNLKVQHDSISLRDIYSANTKVLIDLWGTLPKDITEENLQARIRGNLLMAISNKTGALVLNTSNRSETAVGYSTLYGDMVGGFGVLKDVLKTDVYALAAHINVDETIIPKDIISRPPSAELRPNQTDQDSLPDYHTLDQLIELFIEQEKSIDEIVAKGFPRATVNTIVNKIYHSEYKRRQSTPGIRINHRAFCKDRRYPITNLFYESR
jgi:NAD+ synthase (glutamine-hydrolysing)